MTETEDKAISMRELYLFMGKKRDLWVGLKRKKKGGGGKGMFTKMVAHFTDESTQGRKLQVRNKINPT